LGFYNIKIKKKLTQIFSNFIFTFNKYKLEKKILGYNSGMFFICKPNVFLGLNTLQLSINSNLTIINDIDGIINSHCFQNKNLQNLFAHQINSINNQQNLKKILKFIDTFSLVFFCRIKFINQIIKSFFLTVLFHVNS